MVVSYLAVGGSVGSYPAVRRGGIGVNSYLVVGGLDAYLAARGLGGLLHRCSLGDSVGSYDRGLESSWMSSVGPNLPIGGFSRVLPRCRRAQ